MTTLHWLVIICIAIPMIKGECTANNDSCEFFFNVDYDLTMMHGSDLVYAVNSKLYKYDVTNTSNAQPITDPDIISADGWDVPKLVTTVNGQIPGPNIIVYEGQNVIVNVKNNHKSVAQTIHWHGLNQRKNPFHDGVPWVTQCPIYPGQSFKYKFLANHAGTFWWHGHVGSQRTMGMFGAFIIKERNDSKSTWIDGDVEEFIMQMSGWNHNHDAETGAILADHEIYVGRKKWQRIRSLDGNTYPPFQLQSVLINGKGRYYDPTTGSNNAPLTVFGVTKGRKYRFRVINTGAAYPFRVSVDNHMLTILALDAYDVDPITAESFIINPAERFDFEITADQPVANYWVRGSLLAESDVAYPKAEAILRYDNAPDEHPASSRMQCMQKNPCIVVNCPFQYYPVNHIVCKSFNDIKALSTDDYTPEVKENGFKEYFLNFGFPGNAGTINGRQFDTPDVNPLTQPTEWYSPCDSPKCGGDKDCKCTHALEIGNNDTVQLVLTNMGKGRGLPHPIHIHGHSYYVLKIGYGQFNKETGTIYADNTDIDCRGDPDRTKSFCNNATWTNSSWLNGNVPGLRLERTPRKDTIAVPSGGYVVLRIRANNPGIWNVHCHIELHYLAGMQMVLNESFSEIPPTPDNFPMCHSFPPKIPGQIEPRQLQSSNDKASDSSYIGIIVGVIIVVIFILILVVLYYRGNLIVVLTWRGNLIVRNRAAVNVTPQDVSQELHSIGRTPGNTGEHGGTPGNIGEHGGTPGNIGEHGGTPGNIGEQQRAFNMTSEQRVI